MASKPGKVAVIATIRKLVAVSSTATHRKPFVSILSAHRPTGVANA
jgi:hypothetical protein